MDTDGTQVCGGSLVEVKLHWAATESKNIRIGAGIKRDGWVSIPQAEYPEEQEG
jgi:hypothetical protein